MITCSLHCLKILTSPSISLVDGVQPGLRLHASIHFCRRKMPLGKVNNLLFPLPRNAMPTIPLCHITRSLIQKSHPLARTPCLTVTRPMRLQAGVNRWLHLRTALAISCFQAPWSKRPISFFTNFCIVMARAPTLTNEQMVQLIELFHEELCL
jgi:hypothetical protein